MALTEQDLTDLEISESVGDFGRNSKVGTVVEELRAARARVLELEASPDWSEFRRMKELADAAAKANEALERIGEQARQRIVRLEGALRSVAKVLNSVPDEHRRWDASLPDYIERLADRAEAETPAGDEVTPAARFQVVADLARDGKITTEQARTLLEMPGMDAKQIHRAVHVMLHPVTVIRPAETLARRAQAQHDPGAHIVMREAIEVLRAQRDAHGNKADPYDRLTLAARNLRDAFEWLWPLLWRDDPEFVPFDERKPPGP